MTWADTEAIAAFGVVMGAGLKGTRKCGLLGHRVRFDSEEITLSMVRFILDAFIGRRLQTTMSLKT
eukprot:scaffold186298_cov29-Prasinocladus_malaysianus.AAC.1